MAVASEKSFVTPYHSNLGIDIRKAAVLGGGHMGADGGIQIETKCDYEKVKIIDVVQEQLDKAEERTIAHYASTKFKRSVDAIKDAKEYVGKKFEFILNDLSVVTDSETGHYEGLEDVSYILEAGPETKKKSIYKALAISELRDDVLIASNTSAVPIPEIAEYLGDKASNFGGVHYYSPLIVNDAIDVVSESATIDNFRRMHHIATKMDKKVITQTDQSYSFVGSVLFESAAAIAADAVGGGMNVEDVDRIFEVGGFATGPLKSLDYTQHFAYYGCGSVLKDTLPDDDITKDYYEDDMHIEAFMEKMKEMGWTGMESEEKKGFYDWSSGKPEKALRVYGKVDDALYYEDITLSEDPVFDEIKREEERSGFYRSIRGIAELLKSDGDAGEDARKLLLPFLNEQIRLVKKGTATPGQIYTLGKVGFKTKLTLEVVDFLEREEKGSYMKLNKMAGHDHVSKEDIPEEGFLRYGEFFGTCVSTYENEEAETNFYPDWEIKKYTEVLLEKNIEDGIAVITLHNPGKLNRLSMEMLDQWNEALVDIEGDDRIKSYIVALSGKGTGAGANIFQFLHGKYDGEVNFSIDKCLAMSKAGRAIGNEMRFMDKPSIGMAGNIYGGTAEMMYYLDTMIMIEGSKISQTEYATLGIGGGIGAYPNLKDKIGEKVAMNVCLGNDLTDSDAYHLGLVGMMGENKADTIGKAYRMAEVAAEKGKKEFLKLLSTLKKGGEVRAELVKTKLIDFDINPGESITEKAKELNMSPHALRRLIRKRDHYRKLEGVDKAYEDWGIHEMFAEKNAKIGFQAMFDRKKPEWDYSEEIIYQSEEVPA